MTSTHAELVIRARNWLLQNHDVPKRLWTGSEFVRREVGLYFPCRTAWAEPIGHGGEIPDAFGMVHERITHLIECKTSVSDFNADKKKPSRVDPDTGLGMYRWYLMPRGMVHPLELPARWGLLWAMPKSIQIAKLAEPFETRNEAGEAAIMFHELWYYFRKWRNPDGSKGPNARW